VAFAAPLKFMLPRQLEKPSGSTKGFRVTSRPSAVARATDVANCCFGGLLLPRHVETLLGVLNPMKCLLAQAT
jgi:hypothetical protein